MNSEKEQSLYLQKNNGFVEIEASDNDDVIKNHQKNKDEKKKFLKGLFKELESKDSVKNNISYINDNDPKNKGKIIQMSYLKKLMKILTI